MEVASSALTASMRAAVGDAEQVGVADGENDEVAGVFGGELRALEVVLRGDVVLERGDVDEILSEVGAEVDDLEGADDGTEAGKLETEGGEVELLTSMLAAAVTVGSSDCNSSRRWPLAFF